jgi:uncharacterized protein (TIGR02996 family)
MISDERALLRAVCAAPDDDVPRLVYADWLDEHDRPERAEFIRAQCELATLTEDSPRRRQLAFRCRELLDEHAEEWVKPLPLPQQWCRFHRGFVGRVEVQPEDVEGNAAELFSVNPTGHAWFAELQGEVDALQHVPADNVLSHLELTGNYLGTDALRELMAFRRFPHVRTLTLMFNELRDGAIPTLCDREFFPQATLIKLGGNAFTDAGRQRLRDHFGDRLSFECEREDEYLYTIQNDEFMTGFGKEHTQLLNMVGRDVARFAIFDHAGNLLRTESRHRPHYGYETAVHHWLAELGYEPATIRVKRFKFPDGVGIEGFVPGWVRVLEDPAAFAESWEDLETARRWLDRWLADGKFRWTWVGDDWWLNRDGEVTDT